MIWCLDDTTARSEPSSKMVASNGRLEVLSSCLTVGDSVVTSRTTILEELMQRIICPLTEKLKRKASPWGNAVEELMDVDISLTSVLRGLRKISNMFRLASLKSLRLRDCRPSEYDTRSCVTANDGHRAKWWAYSKEESEIRLHFRFKRARDAKAFGSTA